jgi:deoxyribodipyrimidine photo-lyase
LKPTAIHICWFRRDLRLHDNAALYHALRSGHPVLPVFIFDRNILDKLENKTDRRVEFIHLALQQMQAQLVSLGSSLEVYHGNPPEVFQTLLSTYTIEKVFTNHDYEPYAQERDDAVAALLSASGAQLLTFKDQVIFEKDEVVKDDGLPYTVFTPYSRRWRARLSDFYLQSYPTEKYYANFLQRPLQPIPPLAQIGFRAAGLSFPAQNVSDALIAKYGEQRDYPAIAGTSRLSVHLRFGTVSIRELVRRSLPIGHTFVNELIWRDFYHAILWHFPRVGRGAAFRPEYENIEWRNNKAEFEKWCAGQTGYPIVDAGMRELNATGFMHNRVRMIVASFLTKHLLTDWRWGEAYFAEKLLDFDLAANNGGWQWAAGSGCDAAPYFRVFNPALQTEKFDKSLQYIRRWVPELDSFGYALPVVEHKVARERCLAAYSKALKK